MPSDDQYVPRNDDSAMTNDADIDPIMDEETENPADELGIPPSEYNLEDEALHPDDVNNDDAREDTEDSDEDGSDTTKMG